ncbi:sensor histidine kinase [Streptoalloteichus hindustanus]|uniref:sensor histidine kinase n=1 Tax=Streptoalloteichus hindustanus TaxID=2017 RepID=UPI00190EA63E|nr:histidine kinase [Streptoalloteichus hindustanus]
MNPSANAPGPPGESRRHRVRDAVLWLVFVAVGVLWYRDAHDSSLWLDLVLPVTVLAVAVPVSRRAPVVALGLATLVTALGLSHPVSPATPYVLALAAMSYLLGARSADHRRALVAIAACVAFALVLCALLRVSILAWFFMTAVLPVALVLPWLVGRYRRAQRELVRGGWERAESLEARQREAEEQARLRERTRIAADMHDSLGHALSLIALRAGALQVSPALTPEDRAKARELRAAASDAVEHLRQTISVLRDGAEPDSGVPADETVEALVDRARASAVEVELRRVGEVPELAAQVDRAVYRIVQEGLTNATKHAPGAPVTVEIIHSPDAPGETTVRVVNAAPAEGPLTGLVPGNHGLVGLRERVDLVGGALRAGAHAGGFELVATLPNQPVFPSQKAGDARGRALPSESTRQLARARRRVQLRFVLAFAAPVVTGGVMAVSAVFFAYQMLTCVLRPADYEAVGVGQERAEFAAVLPAQQFRYVRQDMRSAPAPTGSACEYYRSNGNPFEEVDVYRLCFVDSRLVAKDVLSAGSPDRSPR